MKPRHITENYFSGKKKRKTTVKKIILLNLCVISFSERLPRVPTGAVANCLSQHPVPRTTPEQPGAGAEATSKLLFHQAVPNTLNNYLTSELIAQQ